MDFRKAHQHMKRLISSIVFLCAMVFALTTNPAMAHANISVTSPAVSLLPSTIIPVGDKTHHIVGVSFYKVSTGASPSAHPAWFCGCYYVKNVYATGTYNYTEFPITVAATPAPYQQNLTLSFNSSVS